MDMLKSALLEPNPLRRATLKCVKALGLGSYEFHLYRHSLERANYAYIIHQGAKLARRLGLERISVIEFGVAGGNGLVAMERHAEQIERLVGVGIDIYGFDTGQGLPPPEDYRDLPYHWQEGFFRMDRQALEKRLTRAKLVIGDVRDTLDGFVSTHRPAPIAAVAHDFDYYSSTAAALRLFDAGAEHLLPRVFCYFDDTVGGEVELYNDYTGQLGAIRDYNAAQPMRKLATPSYLLSQPLQEPWFRQIFVHHDFSHPRYNQFVSATNQQLQLARP